MESVEIKKLFKGIYNNKTVLLTGHTGFKGSWLAYWLESMGANVIGYALEAPTSPSHFGALALKGESIIADIRNKEMLIETVNKYQPEIVFHLAAQPLVYESYKDPVSTFDINLMGTVNVFEACRQSSSVKAIVNVTSDKCYDNKEWIWGYKETDAMGGYDPYSASKGCAELIANSYRNSFFNPAEYLKGHQVLMASCRAGNVIGGGDWAANRLIPDIIRASTKSENVLIRSPHATRPWEHVLEPLSGYLLVGQRLLEGDVSIAEGWNFGPKDSSILTVQALLEKACSYWEAVQYTVVEQEKKLHEATLLKLDCSKAKTYLQWESVLTEDETIAFTIDWYKGFYQEKNLLTSIQLNQYINCAKIKNLIWTK